MKGFLKEVASYAILIIIILLIRTFIITPVRVDGPSMEDTLYDKELLLLDKISYRFKEISRFDIVVIQNSNEKIIKRVYGLPNDKVEYRGNNLYINGEIVKDIYTERKTLDFNLKDICAAGLKRNRIVTSDEVDKLCNYDTIPNGYYLVLGDNRTVSADSRFYGLIPREHILGKTNIRFWPLNKIGSIDK